jgi:hypothetical protein
MGTESDLRREIAGERAGLNDAVATLREELGRTADRGKKLGTAVGAAAGVAAAVRLALRLKRR